MISIIRHQFRRIVLESEETLELTREMQVTPPDQPAKPEEPLLAAKKPAHVTVMARYLRGLYLRQLFGITEVATLPFELKEPRYDCSNLQAVSHELTMTCTLIALLYEKLSNLRPKATEIAHQAEWDLCQECIEAEREIRDRLLSVEAGLENEQCDSVESDPRAAYLDSVCVDDRGAANDGLSSHRRDWCGQNENGEAEHDPAYCGGEISDAEQPDWGFPISRRAVKIEHARRVGVSPWRSNLPPMLSRSESLPTKDKRSINHLAFRALRDPGRPRHRRLRAAGRGCRRPSGLRAVR